MSAQLQVPVASSQLDAPASRQPVFPTFSRWLQFGRNPLVWLQSLVRENPILSLIAVAVLSLVLVLKGMTLRATIQDAAVGEWIQSHGGQCHAYGDSGHLILSIMTEMFGRGATRGRLISMTHFPASLVNNHHEELFEKLSQLSRLQSIYITSSTLPTQTQPGGPATVAPVRVDTSEIDSKRLQRGIASLGRPIMLNIDSASLTACDQPLDLTRLLTGVSLNNVQLKRNFALGLPVVKNCSYVMVQNSVIDDDAVDILLERVQADYRYFYSCTMTAATHAKLSKAKGVTLASFTILPTNANKSASDSTTKIDQPASEPAASSSTRP